MTGRTDGLSPVAAQHHTILYLVLVFLHHGEKSINRHLVVDVETLVGGKTVPQPFLLLVGELKVGLENGEVITGCTAAEFFLPHAHFLAMPALHATVIDTQCRVGDDQLLVDADHTAVTLAVGTGSERGVEGEHVVVGLFETDAVGFETHGEVIRDVGGQEGDPAMAITFIEGGLGGIDQTGDAVLAVIHRHTVDEDEEVGGVHL